MPKHWKGPRLQAAVGAAISVLALAGCALWASRQNVPSIPTDASHLGYLAGAIGIYALATLGRAWRWDRILRDMRISHRSGDAYALSVVGLMGNAVLPMRGGEVLRMFLMAGRSTARRREILGSIITERLLDVVSLGTLFVVVTFSGVPGTPSGTLAAWLSAIGLALLLAGAYVYLRARRAGRLATFADRVRPVARASRQLLTPDGLLLGGASVAVWSLDGLTMELSANAFGVSLGVDAAVAVVVLASLGAMIPAGPGALGTYDAAALYALGRAGVGSGVAVGSLLVFRAVVLLPVVAVGLLLMLTRYGGLRETLRRGRAAAAGDEPEEPMATSQRSADHAFS